MQDTLPPVLTLNGSNPYYVELGSAFVDPGATAYDLCMGVVPVTITGTVNTNAVSTNTVTYTATDGNGNTNTATRTVLVRDTTPPTIVWSFTNLVLAAGTNCTAGMPKVTGTDYIVATDWSGTLTLTQVPTNNAVLPLGTNIVVITVADASGNAAYSTNQIIVQDQTPPVMVLEPQSQTNTIGASASLSVAAVACTPLSFQWYFDNTPLAAQTNSTLGLSNLNTSAAGDYFAVVSASGGAATSAVATLTVVLPPTITVPPSAQIVQCGSNAAFSVTATGTLPLNYQWTLDGAPLAGATNTSLLLTNVHLPTHAVAVVVTNLYGSATSAVALVVQDTLPPVLTLNGSNPYYVELGSAFLDPGATAYDLCMGVVPVTITGTVNTNAVSTNTVTYTATDGNGNTNTATRTVLVRDTTPPTILWSFTNLVLAAGTNCTASMPNVTGTNDILATDWSGPLTLTQVPTNNAVLPLGTNVVVITVADASGNAAYSTNQIVVQDQTPPVMVLQPQSQTSHCRCERQLERCGGGLHAALLPVVFRQHAAGRADQQHAGVVQSQYQRGGGLFRCRQRLGWCRHQRRGHADRGAAAHHYRSAVGADRAMRQQRRLQRHGHRHAAAQLSMDAGRCADCGRDQHQPVADQRPSAHARRRGCGDQSLRQRDQCGGARRARHPAAGPHPQRQQSLLCRVGQRVC